MRCVNDLFLGNFNKTVQFSEWKWVIFVNLILPLVNTTHSFSSPNTHWVLVKSPNSSFSHFFSNARFLLKILFFKRLRVHCFHSLESRLLYWTFSWEAVPRRLSHWNCHFRIRRQLLKRRCYRRRQLRMPFLNCLHWDSFPFPFLDRKVGVCQPYLVCWLTEIPSNCSRCYGPIQLRALANLKRWPLTASAVPPSIYAFRRAAKIPTIVYASCGTPRLSCLLSKPANITHFKSQFWREIQMLKLRWCWWRTAWHSPWRPWWAW